MPLTTAMKRIVQILQMIRFSHTLFALPFALLAAVMAWTAPGGGLHTAGFGLRQWQELLGILVCMVAARSAAMAANRMADRHLDADNPRTAGRHLPAEVLSLRSVAIFAAASSVGLVAGTLLFLPNRLPLYLSLPVLAFLWGYSYAKRFTALAHFWLGAALMLAPVSTWIAIRGKLVLADPADLVPAIVLGTGVLLWVAGFDIIYACLDVDYDRRRGLYSVPARWGPAAALRIAALCHLGMVVVLMSLPWFGPQLGLGWIYYCGIVAVAALLIYEHLLVRPDDLERVNVAFFNVNAVVSIGLFVVGCWDLLT